MFKLFTASYIVSFVSLMSYMDGMFIYIGVRLGDVGVDGNLWKYHNYFNGYKNLRLQNNLG